MPVIPGRNPYSLHDPRCDMQFNDSGNDVKALQDALNRCYGRSLSVDGKFGPNTQAALRYAQGVEGLGVDGYCDGWAEAWFLKFYGHYEDGNGNVRNRCARWNGG
jgi:peptidoglycan hydrolase-like protein with peptidoglycan-binding domain